MSFKRGFIQSLSWLVNDMGEGDEDGDSYSDEDCISSDWKQVINSITLKACLNHLH